MIMLLQRISCACALPPTASDRGDDDQMICTSGALPDDGENIGIRMCSCKSWRIDVPMTK